MKSRIKFEDYLPAIRKLAHSFHRTTGLPYEDLFSEACMAYVKARRSYKQNRSKFITYLYHVCRRELIDYSAFSARYTEYIKVEELPIPPQQLIDQLTPERHMMVKDMIEQLGDEARAIVQMILSAPQEYLGNGSPKRARGGLIKKLRSMGWSWPKIWGAFTEIKLALNEICT